MSVGQQLSGDEFRVDFCSPIEGMAEPFDHEHRRPFSHNEARAAGVKRSTSTRRILVVRQNFHVMKAGGKEGMNSFGTPGKCDVTLIVLDGPHCAQDVDHAAHASRAVTKPWPV